MATVNGKVAAARVPTSHSAGFDAALDRALANAGRLGKGEFEVDVHFWAVVEVTNPGQIQQYCATLTTRGGGGG
jgi:hypothetical protein